MPAERLHLHKSPSSSGQIHGMSPRVNQTHLKITAGTCIARAPADNAAHSLTTLYAKLHEQIYVNVGAAVNRSDVSVFNLTQSVKQTGNASYEGQL